MPVGRRRRKPEGTVRKSCVRVRCRRHTKRRRNSKLANDKKTAEVKNARRGRKSDNAPAAKVAVVSERKNPIPLRLGLEGMFSGSVISQWLPAYNNGPPRTSQAESEGMNAELRGLW